VVLYTVHFNLEKNTLIIFEEMRTRGEGKRKKKGRMKEQER